MSRTALSLAIVLCLTIVPSAGSQIAESIEVSIANLDVVVLDRSGNPVRGLKPADFEVFENGVKQEISNFAEYSSELPKAIAGGPDSAAASRPAASRERLMVIVVDIDDIEQVHRQEFFSGLRTFMAQEQRPGDQAAILLWTTRLRVAIPPTTDFKAVDAALATMQRYQKWSEMEVLEELKDLRMAGVESAAQNLGPGQEGMIDVDAEKQFEQWIVAEQRCNYITRKIEAFRELVTSLGAIEMQKVMILASDDLVTKPSNTCFLEANYESLAATANTYGFTIHAFHPSGVRIQSNIESRFPMANEPPHYAGQNNRTFLESQGLEILANQTGGQFAVGAIVSVRSLDTVAKTLDNYYSVAYRLHGDRPNKARRVVVKTRNRSWTVRTRRSLVAFSDDRRISDAVVAGLYTNPQPDSRFPVRLSVREISRNGGEVRIKITVTVPLNRLSLVPDAGGNVAGHFAVYCAAGREVGDASPVGKQEQRFSRPASSVRENESIEYRFEMKARSTTRRVAIAVRDELTHEYGIATHDVKVPNS